MASLPNNEKEIFYGNLLDKINALRVRLWGPLGNQELYFSRLCNVQDMNRESNNFLPLSDYTPPKSAF